MSHLFDVEDVTSEVFYAELLGEALSVGSISNENLATVAKQNPLALFEALRVIRTPLTAPHKSVVNSAIQWAGRPEMLDEVPEALRFAVGSTLMATDSPIVLEIARCLPSHHIVLAAGLRNGDAWAGVCLIGASAGDVFDPAITENWRNPAVNQAFLRVCLGMKPGLQVSAKFSYEQVTR